MISFTCAPEPDYFEERVRRRGLSHISKYPSRTSKFTSYWCECADDLKQAFSSLCAYSAVEVEKGDVDHFVSQSESCKSNQKHLIYEWSNYRYADPTVNQTKSKLSSSNILDPFIIQDDWFVMDIPSSLLQITESIDVNLREKAKTTIDRLKLNGPYVKGRRERIYREFVNGEVSLTNVRRRCPLVYRAIQDRLVRANITSLHHSYQRILNGIATLSELEEYDPNTHKTIIVALETPLRKLS